MEKRGSLEVNADDPEEGVLIMRLPRKARAVPMTIILDRAEVPWLIEQLQKVAES